MKASTMKSAVALLALGLWATIAFAGKAPDYLASATWGVDPVIKGQIKLACAEGTAFKNEFPLLTNGGGPGTSIRSYMIPAAPESADQAPLEVEIEVSWNGANAFDFAVLPREAPIAAVSRMIVSSGSTLDYDYLAVLGEAKSSDTGVHKVAGGGVGPDVSHLDFCLVAAPPPPPVDTDAPVIGDVDIRAVPGEGTVDSQNGVFTVSGLVDVVATVMDDSGFSVTIQLNGEELGEATATDPAFPDLYTYQWATTSVPNGTYTLKIVATDESGNEEMVTLTVTVLTPFEICLEEGDGIPLGRPGEGGCSIPGVTLEYPEELRDVVSELGLTATQALVRAKPNAEGGNQTVACGLDQNMDVVSEFIAQDSRVDGDGKILAFTELDLSTLFDIQGHFEEFHPEKLAELDGVAPRPRMGDTEYFVPCGVLYHQHGPNFDEFGRPAEFYFAEDTGGPTAVLTQNPVDVPEMFASAPRLTAPLNFCDPDAPDCQPPPACHADETVKCYQPFQSWVEKATVSPDDLTLNIRPFLMLDATLEVFNAARARTFKGTFAALNARNVCVDLESDTSMLEPYSAAYLQAEYECKIGQANELFFDLEEAIKQSARNLPSSNDVNAILNPHSKALSQIKVERFDRALRDLNDLLNEVASAPWAPIDEFNDPGRLVMYTQALIFRVDQLRETQRCLGSAACLADLESLAQP